MQKEIRTFKRYSLTFKRKVVSEIKEGKLGIFDAKRLYNIMGERGNPYENAVAERVNGILKNEFLLDQTYCSVVTVSLQKKWWAGILWQK